MLHVNTVNIVGGDYIVDGAHMGPPTPLSLHVFRRAVFLTATKMGRRVLAMSITTTRDEGGPLVLLHEPLPPDAKEQVLMMAARTGRPITAAEDLGYSPLSYDKTLRADPAFSAAVQACVGRHVERLEETADARAVEGWKEPVYQKGEYVGDITKYDHTLLMRRLEALAPERYRKQVQVDATVKAGLLVVPATPPDSAAWAKSFAAEDRSKTD